MMSVGVVGQFSIPGGMTIEGKGAPPSTSTSTGALIVKGGMGVNGSIHAKAMYINGQPVGVHASTATNIAGGIPGGLLIQKTQGITDFVPVGNQNDILCSSGDGAKWVSPSDIKIGSALVAEVATKLSKPIDIVMVGDVDGILSIDGSSTTSTNVTIPLKGKPGGFATLDSSGKIPPNQVPQLVAVDNTLSSTSTVSALSAAMGKKLFDSKQDSLGFIPVQQETTDTTIVIGWTGSQLSLRVGTSYYGSAWPINVTSPEIDAVLFSPIPYPSTTPPPGFLMMMGQTISESVYPKLYALYGSALPDMRGYFIRGWDNNRGVDPGRTILSSQLDEYKSHSHDSTGVGQGEQPVGAGTPIWGNNPVRTGLSGGDETRPKNVAYNYIVKAG